MLSTRIPSARTVVLALIIACGDGVASPIVTTLPAGAGAGVATMNALVTTSNASTTVYFQYGLTASYDTATRKTSLSGGAGSMSFGYTVSGLQLETAYHFRAVAYNSTGTNFGGDLTFTTTAATAPVITTNFTSAVGATNVTLNGKLFCSGLDSGGWFEYGLTTNYGNVTVITNLGGGTTNRNFSLSVGGLVPSTNYYFRAVATNGLGLAYGVGQGFTTATFQDVTTNLAPGLGGLFNTSVAWGDYDNDGRLDFLVTGMYDNNRPYVTQIWRNTGNGFTNVTATVAPGLPLVQSGAVAWGDYDNDGRLDFILTGTGNYYAGGGASQIWHNTGSNFVNVTASVASNLPGLSFGAVAWGDYDNDGRLDFVVSGPVNTNPYPAVTQIWHNTGSNFVNVTPVIASNLSFGSDLAWGDYDNDGRLDLLLVMSKVAQIWHNTGTNFINVTASIAPSLTGPTYGGTVAWADYDNDGSIDFLLVGSDIAQIWHNTGTNFVDVTASVAPTVAPSETSARWGDFDNDGRLDFFLAGQIWHNTGSNFVNVTASVAPNVPALYLGSVAWGDFDGDGRLDLFVTGYVGQYQLGKPISQILLNFTPETNAPPTAPSGLAMTSSTKGALLSWNAATDAKTPSAALTYNVRASTDAGGTNLVAFHSATNGFRLIPAMGNAQERLFMPLDGFTNGQPVYWSVQAINNGFVGGPFSTQCCVISIPRMNLTSDIGTNAILSWNPPTWGWRLQESADLRTWNDSPVGEVNPMPVSPTNVATFYRLFNP